MCFSKIGLGNGKKRSKDYEQYVLVHRDKMRNDMNLCEPLTQSILGYSNNFLHKRLLTEQVCLPSADADRTAISELLLPVLFI